MRCRAQTALQRSGGLLNGGEDATVQQTPELDPSGLRCSDSADRKPTGRHNHAFGSGRIASECAHQFSHDCWADRPMWCVALALNGPKLAPRDMFGIHIYSMISRAT